MTTDIINLASQVGRRYQLNVTSGSSTAKTSSVSESNSDNIVRINLDKRQAVANNAQIQEQQSDTQNTAISDSVADLSRSVQSITRSLEFSIDDKSGKSVITVRDGDSKEIIRQFPSEQILKISARLQEVQAQRFADPNAEVAGILFTEKT